MPVRYAGRGEWTVAGRVVALPFPGGALVDVGDDVVLVNGPVDDLAPGDLARFATIVDPDPGDKVVPRDPPVRVYLAEMPEHVERVLRPRRDPWGAEGETAAMTAGDRRGRLALRAAIVERVREHFKRHEFLEVETPLVVPSPGLDLHLAAYEARGPRGAHAGYLITSPEYHMKRLLVGGVARCFQLARCVRADELGKRHEPEFTMVEWYRAWDGLEAILADTESLVRLASGCGGPTPGSFFVDGEEVDLRGPFERLTVREAFARFAPDAGDPVELAARDEEAFFRALVEQVEPRVGRERPTFLTRWPASQASLARIAPDDPTVAERFELYVRGVELCNGFVELSDPDEQRARLERDQRERAKRALPVYPIDARFLAALEEGMPPAVGNALGLDRLVALVAGAERIADVMAFPAARK